jgi:MOSC domain-containing protein YiiM
MSEPRLIAVCTSKNKGTTKKDIAEGWLDEGFGLRGDAHGGDWHRQISLLAIEDVESMKAKGFDVGPGSFAENLTTEGFDLAAVTIGDRLRIGEGVILEVTQIGKECHTRCAVYNKIGECVMPERGVFAKIIKGGFVKTGDTIAIA